MHVTLPDGQWLGCYPPGGRVDGPIRRPMARQELWGHGPMSEPRTSTTGIHGRALTKHFHVYLCAGWCGGRSNRHCVCRSSRHCASENIGTICASLPTHLPCPSHQVPCTLVAPWLHRTSGPQFMCSWPSLQYILIVFEKWWGWAGRELVNGGACS